MHPLSVEIKGIKSMENLDRNEARKIFAESGLTYKHATRDNLQKLRNLINAKMVKGKYIRGSFKCKQRPFLQDDNSGGLYAGVRCKAFYFNDREAVTFNYDGFIGFAGWASDTNIKPILEGFIQWVTELKKTDNQALDLTVA